MYLSGSEWLRAWAGLEKNSSYNFLKKLLPKWFLTSKHILRNLNAKYKFISNYFFIYILWLLKDKGLSKTCPQTQNTFADPARPTNPQSQKESKHSYPPPLHLQKMSEDPEINKKCDGECAPVHPEVPSVRVHEKMSLTRDVTGSNREPHRPAVSYSTQLGVCLQTSVLTKNHSWVAMGEQLSSR